MGQESSKKGLARFQVRIYFEDTDCGQIVYHTNYIKYCERARSEMFFSKKIPPFEKNAGFVLKSLQADFCAPSRLGDLLEVRTQVRHLKNASVELEQDIYKIYDALLGRQSDELVFQARITLAFLDVASGRICKIPPSMRAILA